MKLEVTERRYRLRKPFTIARGTRSEAHEVVVSIEADAVIGRGTCVPYDHYGETARGTCRALRSLAMPIDRRTLQDALPPGAARNAVDCALWDLEAKQAGCRVWELAGLDEPQPIESAVTISLASPDAMRRDAAASGASLIKVKLGGEEDIACLHAVREGATQARLIVDANEGWTVQGLDRMLPALHACKVEMVEQPFPPDHDPALDALDCDILMCADESCRKLADLPGLEGRYDMINIKLDKTGGLTGALAMQREAHSRGFAIMVGCMLGSSLSIAPACLIAQQAMIADLDAPLLLAEDEQPAVRYDGNWLQPPAAELWG